MPERFSGTALVLGGARSGKSGFAERLADESGLDKIYLATSEIRDGEMAERIAHHKARRGDDWRLVEEPLNLAGSLDRYVSQDAVVLVDCLTLWLTNLMMAGRDIEAECTALVDGLPDGNVVFVSNEVGQGIVPMDRMARDFRDHAGRLHQTLATACQHVWFVTAGLPQKLK